MDALELSKVLDRIEAADIRKGHIAGLREALGIAETVEDRLGAEDHGSSWEIVCAIRSRISNMEKGNT